MKNFSIKKLEENDLSELLAMLKELAIYENILDELKCDERILHENLLENCLARAFILREGEKIIGYAICYKTFSSFLGRGGLFLEDIFIRENYRKKGYGRAVFNFLGQICRDENLCRLEWICLNENLIGIKFYEKLGAIHLKNWRKYRISGQKLANL